MRVVYVCHPVGQGDEVAPNLARARRWIAWFMAHSPPDTVWIAPWLLEAELRAHDGRDPVVREQILRRCEEVVMRCDAVALAGGRISPGMEREAAIAKEVHDFTNLGEEPPMTRGEKFEELCRRIETNRKALGEAKAHLDRARAAEESADSAYRGLRDESLSLRDEINRLIFVGGGE